MTWRDLFLWWNAIYSVPLLFALLYFGVSLLLGALTGDHDTDHDADTGDVEADAAVEVDHEVDLDHDVDLGAEHDVDLDQDLEMEHDVAAEQELHQGAAGAGSVSGHAAGSHGAAAFLGPLVFLGVGRAPLSLVIQFFLITWGVLGLCVHSLVGIGSPIWLAASLPISLVGSIFATRGLALTFGKVFRKETYALSRSEFVGKTGRVVFPVTAEEGTIHFRDEHGTLQRVRARTEHDRLESGQEIVILGYDPAQNVYMVDDAQQFVRRGG